MKGLLPVLGVVFVAVSLSATRLAGQTASPVYEFAGLNWGAYRPAVKSALTALGLRFDSTDADGDGRFSGTLNGEQSIVFALMTPQGQLSKVDIRLITSDQRARDVYRSMKETLIGKYGNATNCVEGFVSPYYEGDGFEEQAIRLGKGHFICIWGSRETGVLGLDITERLTVAIEYESAGWYATESPRRKNTATRAF